MSRVMRKPTLKDVAKKAGVAISTASVVLNAPADGKFVSDRLRLRVMQAARQLNYLPNIPARRMKGKGGKTLAILVPQFENFFFNRIVIGAESYANANDYTLSIYSTFDLEQKELKFIQTLISLQVDGVLIAPAMYDSQSVAMLREMGIPYVVVDRPVAGNGYDLVVVDNYLAAYQGTQYLIEQGHRRMALFGWRSDLSTITDRVKGFLDAAYDAGIDPADVAVFESERTREAGGNLARQALKDGRFTAVFAAYHPIGEGVIDALRFLGKRIPDDVSVLIYGNPIWASITTPGFSSLVQPDLELGRKAAELIIDQLENPGHVCREYSLQAQLLRRESVKTILALPST